MYSITPYIWEYQLINHAPSTLIHPTSVIIMNLDVDPNSITASDYVLICTHWKVPDPSKAGKQLTTYRCPKGACVSIATEIYTKYDNNSDGRFIFVNKGTGFTNLKQHLSKCIGPAPCLKMVMEAKKIELSKSGHQQRLLTDLLIMAHFKSRSARENVIYDFVQKIVDKGQPLRCVDDGFFRKLVYRSHGVEKCGNPVCRKTVRAVLVCLIKLL